MPFGSAAFVITGERNRMKKSSIILGYDEERLSAARLYLKRKGLTLEEEMAAYLDRLYEKNVPPGVREYIEERSPGEN